MDYNTRIPRVLAHEVSIRSCRIFIISSMRYTLNRSTRGLSRALSESEVLGVALASWTRRALALSLLGLNLNNPGPPISQRVHVLYCTILYYTTLYYTILYYTILYYTILHYTILYYTILYYTILYYTILYYTLLYSTLLYSTLLYSTLLYSTLLYYTILYYTIQYFQRVQVPND